MVRQFAGGLHVSECSDLIIRFFCLINILINDAAHIVAKGPHIHLWQGDELALWEGIKILLIGGHFEGSSLKCGKLSSDEEVSFLTTWFRNLILKFFCKPCLLTEFLSADRHGYA